MNPRISKFEIKGFKSIQEATIEAQQLNIFIGANGAGKSNLIAFFTMLSWMVKSVDRFQEHIAELGFASSILFDGPAVTREVEGQLMLTNGNGLNEYRFRLAYAAPDRLYFAEEAVRHSSEGQVQGIAPWEAFGTGHSKSKLNAKSADSETVKAIGNLLKKIFVYQFHNTSPRAEIRNSWSKDDGRWLKENGANLGSFLLHMQETNGNYYLRLVRYLQRALLF